MIADATRLTGDVARSTTIFLESPFIGDVDRVIMQLDVFSVIAKGNELYLNNLYHTGRKHTYEQLLTEQVFLLVNDLKDFSDVILVPKFVAKWKSINDDITIVNYTHLFLK